MTEDARLQELILEAYVASFTTSAQVRMLRDENRLGTQAISRIRQLRADSGRPKMPVVVYSATKGLPRSTRYRWTKRQAQLIGTVPGSEHVVAEGVGHSIHQERPELVAEAVIRLVQGLPRATA